MCSRNGKITMAAVHLGKAWRRKSLVKNSADAAARANIMADVASNPLGLELVEAPPDEPRRGSVSGAFSALAGGSKWKNMLGSKKKDLPLPDPADGAPPLNPQAGRRRSFGMAASARSLGAISKLRAKLKGDGDDDDDEPKGDD